MGAGKDGLHLAKKREIQEIKVGVEDVKKNPTMTNVIPPKDDIFGDIKRTRSEKEIVVENELKKRGKTQKEINALNERQAFIKESKKGLDKRSLDLEKAIKGTKGKKNDKFDIHVPKMSVLFKEYKSSFTDRVTPQKRLEKIKNKRSRLFVKANNAETLAKKEQSYTSRNHECILQVISGMGEELDTEQTHALSAFMNTEKDGFKENKALVDSYLSNDKTAALDIITKKLFSIDTSDLSFDDDTRIAEHAEKFEQIAGSISAYDRLLEDNPNYIEGLKGGVREALEKRCQELRTIACYYLSCKDLITDEFYRTHYNEEMSMDVDTSDPNKDHTRIAEKMSRCFVFGRDLIKLDPKSSKYKKLGEDPKFRGIYSKFRLRMSKNYSADKKAFLRRAFVKEDYLAMMDPALIKGLLGEKVLLSGDTTDFRRLSKEYLRRLEYFEKLPEWNNLDQISDRRYREKLQLIKSNAILIKTFPLLADLADQTQRMKVAHGERSEEYLGASSQLNEYIRVLAPVGDTTVLTARNNLYLKIEEEAPVFSIRNLNNAISELKALDVKDIKISNYKEMILNYEHNIRICKRVENFRNIIAEGALNGFKLSDEEYLEIRAKANMFNDMRLFIESLNEHVSTKPDFLNNSAEEINQVVVNKFDSNNVSAERRLFVPTGSPASLLKNYRDALRSEHSDRERIVKTAWKLTDPSTKIGKEKNVISKRIPANELKRRTAAFQKNAFLSEYLYSFPTKLACEKARSTSIISNYCTSNGIPMETVDRTSQMLFIGKPADEVIRLYKLYTGTPEEKNTFYTEFYNEYSKYNLKDFSLSDTSKAFNPDGIYKRFLFANVGANYKDFNQYFEKAQKNGDKKTEFPGGFDNFEEFYKDTKFKDGMYTTYGGRFTGVLSRPNSKYSGALSFEDYKNIDPNQVSKLLGTADFAQDADLRAYMSNIIFILPDENMSVEGEHKKKYVRFDEDMDEAYKREYKKFYKKDPVQAEKKNEDDWLILDKEKEKEFVKDGENKDEIDLERFKAIEDKFKQENDLKDPGEKIEIDDLKIEKIKDEDDFDDDLKDDFWEEIKIEDVKREEEKEKKGDEEKEDEKKEDEKKEKKEDEKKEDEKKIEEEEDEEEKEEGIEYKEEPKVDAQVLKGFSKEERKKFAKVYKEQPQTGNNVLMTIMSAIANAKSPEDLTNISKLNPNENASDEDKLLFRYIQSALQESLRSRGDVIEILRLGNEGFSENDLQMINWFLNELSRKEEYSEDDIIAFRAMVEKKENYEEKVMGTKVGLLTHELLFVAAEAWKKARITIDGNKKDQKIWRNLREGHFNVRKAGFDNYEREIPNVRQSYGYSCWATSASVMSNWYMKNVLNQKKTVFTQDTFCNGKNLVLNPFAKERIDYGKAHPEERVLEFDFETEQNNVKDFLTNPNRHMGNAYAMADVMMRQMPHTAIRRLRFNIGADNKFLKGKNFGLVEKRQLGAMIFEKIANELDSGSGPISVLLPGINHYLTIVAIKEDGTLVCRDSSKKAGTGKRELTKEEFVSKMHSISVEEHGEGKIVQIEEYQFEMICLKDLSKEGELQKIKQDCGFKGEVYDEDGRLQITDKAKVEEEGALENLAHNLGVGYEVKKPENTMLDLFMGEIIYLPKNLDNVANVAENLVPNMNKQQKKHVSSLLEAQVKAVKKEEDERKKAEEKKGRNKRTKQTEKKDETKEENKKPEKKDETKDETKEEIKKPRKKPVRKEENKKPEVNNEEKKERIRRKRKPQVLDKTEEKEDKEIEYFDKEGNLVEKEFDLSKLNYEDDEFTDADKQIIGDEDLEVFKDSVVKGGKFDTEQIKAADKLVKQVDQWTKILNKEERGILTEMGVSTLTDTLYVDGIPLKDFVRKQYGYKGGEEKTLKRYVAMILARQNHPVTMIRPKIEDNTIKIGYENLEMNMSKLEKTRGDRHKGLEYRVLGQAVANGLQAREGNKELVRAGMAYRRINNIHISEIENLESAVEKITRTGAGKGKNFDEMQTNLLAYHELIETVAAGSKDRKISRDDALRAYNRINSVAAAGKRYLKGKNLSDPKFAAINEIYRLAEYHTQILFDELQRGSLKRKGSSVPLDRIFSSVDSDDDDE